MDMAGEEASPPPKPTVQFVHVKLASVCTIDNICKQNTNKMLVENLTIFIVQIIKHFCWQPLLGIVQEANIFSVLLNSQHRGD